MACENIHSHICDYLWCSLNSMHIIVASTIFSTEYIFVSAVQDLKAIFGPYFVSVHDM